MTRVFISHATKDRDFVEKEIISLLQRHGIQTWYSKDDIQTASHWEQTIRLGLESCDWFLVVLTPRSVTSPWVQAEVHWALDERNDRFVPVLAEDCEWLKIHLMMRTIQFVDFRQVRGEAQRRLLKCWNISPVGPERDRVDDGGNKESTRPTEVSVASSSRERSSPPPAPPTAKPQTVPAVKGAPRTAPSQTTTRSGETLVMPPQYAAALSASGIRPRVGLPPPIPGHRSLDGLGSNLAWWVIGATAGAAVGGNLGRLGLALLLALGFHMGVWFHGENVPQTIEAISLLIGAVVGAAVGTVFASLGEVWGPKRNAAVRGVLTAALAGWLVLQICGRIGLPFSGGSSDFTPLWGITGGLVGMVAGILGVSSWTKYVRGLLGPLMGGILLAALDLLLAQPWSTGACFLFGALAGVTAEFLAQYAASSRRDRSHWLLVAVGAWALFEAITIDVHLLAALALFAVLGGVVGFIVYTVRERLDVGAGR